MRRSFCRKEVYRIIRYNEFAYAIYQREIFLDFYYHLTGDFFNPADGRQMYIKAPKRTITPASHGVVAEKHHVAIANTPEIKY